METSHQPTLFATASAHESAMTGWIQGHWGSGATTRLLNEAHAAIATGQTVWLLASPLLLRHKLRHHVTQTQASRLHILSAAGMARALAEALKAPAYQPLLQWQSRLWLQQALETTTHSSTDAIAQHLTHPDIIAAIDDAWQTSHWQQTDPIAALIPVGADDSEIAQRIRQALRALEARCVAEAKGPIGWQWQQLLDNADFKKPTFNALSLFVDNADDTHRWPPLCQALFASWVQANRPLIATGAARAPWLPETATLLPNPPITEQTLLPEAHLRANAATRAWLQGDTIDTNTTPQLSWQTFPDDIAEWDGIAAACVSAYHTTPAPDTLTDVSMAVLVPPSMQHRLQPLAERLQAAAIPVIAANGQPWPTITPEWLFPLHGWVNAANQPNLDELWPTIATELLNLPPDSPVPDGFTAPSNLTLASLAQAQHAVKAFFQTPTEDNFSSAWLVACQERLIEAIGKAQARHVLLSQWDNLMQQAQEAIAPSVTISFPITGVLLTTWPQAKGLTISHLWLPGLSNTGCQGEPPEALHTSMAQATHTLMLSWPSQTLSPEHKNTVQDNDAWPPVHTLINQLATHDSLNAGIKTSPASAISNPWAALPIQPSVDSVWPTGHTLPLSASAIRTYMACPRQFMYRHWLQLPTPPSDTLHFGLIVHALLETFNRHVHEKRCPHTLEALLELFTEFQRPTASALFNTEHVERWQSVPPAQQIAMQVTIQQAFNELAESGYFDATPDAVFPEVSVKFTLPELDNVAWSGTLDAVQGFKRATDTWHWRVLDYKTDNLTKWRAEPEKRTAQLGKVLTPLPKRDDALSHEVQFKGYRDRNYQIPLYTAALQHDTSLSQQRHAVGDRATAPQLDGVGLQLVRPPIGSDDTTPHTARTSASPAILLTSPDLPTQASHSLADVYHYVAQPLMTTSELTPAPGQVCRQCDYARLCPATWQTNTTAEEGE